MLLHFLTKNIITVSDDANLDKLKKACTELERRINKKKHRIITFTLLAIDPDVRSDNEDLEEVQQLIIDKWPTFTANNNDTPLPFLRAIILEALSNLSKQAEIACIIWLTGRNVSRVYNLQGNEYELIRDFLLSLGNKVQVLAEQTWIQPTLLENPLVEIASKDVGPAEVDAAILEKKLEDASGPHNRSGASNYGSSNPYFPNNPTNWSYEFAPRAAMGIAEVVNKALLKQSKGVQVVQDHIKSAVEQLLVEVQSKLSEYNSTSKVKSQLLWWKEAAYSLSLRESYRGKTTGLLELVLAYDYSNFMPEVYPASADYFFKEAHVAIATNSQKKTSLKDILLLLVPVSKLINEVLNISVEHNKRISLISFIKGLVGGHYGLEQLQELTGISETSEMTTTQFALWLFHDIHSLKILKNLSDGKKV